jgi:hypothetical protein
MSPLVDNPFAALTTVVAPAVLTNACSVLCLGTSNRIARVVDQSREVGNQLRALLPHSPERSLWENELAVLRKRARLLFWTLRFFYASLGAFATAALVAVVGSAVASSSISHMFEIAAIVGLIVGAVGVVGLTTGCVLMVQEVRLALNQTADEADRILSQSREPVVSTAPALPTIVSATR